jgi:hypothetical protein
VSGCDFTPEDVQIARMSREYKGEILAIGPTGLAYMASKVAKLVRPGVMLVAGNDQARAVVRVLAIERTDKCTSPSCRDRWKRTASSSAAPLHSLSPIRLAACPAALRVVCGSQPAIYSPQKIAIIIIFGVTYKT